MPDQPDVAELDAALRRRKGRLTFTPALERAYEADTGAARTARIVGCNMLGATAFFLQTSLVADTVAKISPLMQPMRVGTVALVLAAAFILLWRRRTVPTTVVEFVTTAGTLMVSAYGLTAAHFPSADVGIVIQAGGLFAIFLHTGLAARQQFRYTLFTGGVVLAVYVLTVRSHDEAQAVIVAGNVLLMSTTYAFTLMANYVLEYRERRAYLLQSLEARHRRALADIAEALRRQSLTDALTGLANRRHFDAALHTAWEAAAAAGQPLAVLQVDVDFFKRYNDHYGHPVGDACLRRLAQALDTIALQHQGLAARTGGEEFALLLPQLTLDAAIGVGDALRRAVQALALAHADSPVAPCVTVSVGAAATVPGAAHRAADLLRAGDQALYDAKRAGRDRVAHSAVAAAAVPAAVTLPPEERQIEVEEDAVQRLQAEALALRIDALRQALQRGLHRLRFPGELEAAYQAALAPARAPWLLALGVGGLVYLALYVWLSSALLGDVADRTLHSVLLLSVVALPVLAWIRRPIPAWQRETLFSGLAVTLSLGIVLPLMTSQRITAYSYALTLFLVPMFSTVIAAQPFRHSLAVCTLVLAATVGGMYPSRPEWLRLWLAMSGLLFTGIAFTLVGGYLTDLSARRDYLLGRIGEAQRLLLTRNTQRLRQLADADPLTGLANRRWFDAEHAALTQACAAQQRPLALLIFDIDHFKRYNDSHGHLAGDACLKRVAAALCLPLEAAPAANGPAGTLARLGGEEFGLLLPGCDAEQALAWGTALCERVRRLGIPHLDSPTAPCVTVSVGAASVMPGAGSEPRLLLQRADAALYSAKRQGRDRASNQGPDAAAG